MAMDDLEGVTIIEGDIKSPAVLKRLQDECRSEGRVVDVLLSDMAHPFTGSKSADVPRVHQLVEFALQTALLPQILKPGGSFVAKYLHGEGEDDLRRLVASHFTTFRTFKPKACRDASTEAYYIGIGFKSGVLGKLS
ncbi:hypothetical protein HDU91_001892 [Kappamyces sp. JEL0680]|nr:hypothetical protein HDU91_001892 [Kappamyces sp. JEL0680]